MQFGWVGIGQPHAPTGSAQVTEELPSHLRDDRVADDDKARRPRAIINAVTNLDEFPSPGTRDVTGRPLRFKVRKLLKDLGPRRRRPMPLPSISMLRASDDRETPC